MEYSFQGLAMVVLVVSAAALEVAVQRADAICNLTTEQLQSCRPAVSGSDPPSPTAECCAAVSNADLPCLCSYRHSLLLPSLGIDPDLAMQLPEKCGLTPPAQC